MHFGVLHLKFKVKANVPFSLKNVFSPNMLLIEIFKKSQCLFSVIAYNSF